MSSMMIANTNNVATQQVNRELMNRFINYLDTSKKTIETYTRALKQFFMYLSTNGISHPVRADVVAYRDLLKVDHKPTTVQNYLTAVKVFFKWTAQEGLYPNIAEHIKGARIDTEHKKDYLTTRQVKEVIGSIDKDGLKGLRDYAIITLMVTGGLRTIEVVRANIEDMRTLGDDTVLYVQGKGREEKTEYIKLPAQVEKAIRDYLRERGKAEPSAPLFASTSNNNGGGRMTTRAVSGLAKESLKNAGYDSERLTAHSLRHTAVTLSLLAGQSLEEVQQFARHSKINTTMIYNHALDKAKNGCSNAIATAIF